MPQHFKNRCTLLAIVAGLLLTPSAPIQAEAGAPASTFGETVDVRVVNVEAVVTDKSGTRILTMEVESALLFGYPAHSDQLAVEIGRSQRRKQKRMQVPVTVRLPTSSIALVPTGDDKYSAQLEVRIAVLDARGDRSEVTTLPWNVTRGRLPDEDEAIEFTTSLLIRRQPHDLVIAVYDTKTGALFSSSASVDPVS